MEKPFIAHIGGAFIYSQTPKKLADWYHKHLGIEYKMVEQGSACFASFFYKETEGSKKGYFAWSIIKSKYRPKTKFQTYMINYKVNDLEKLVTHLESLDVKVKGIEKHKEGNFAWISDPEGNHI